jgi:hypothetical protein
VRSAVAATSRSPITSLQQHAEKRGLWSRVSLSRSDWRFLRGCLGVELTLEARPGAGEHRVVACYQAVEASREQIRIRLHTAASILNQARFRC